MRNYILYTDSTCDISGEMYEKAELSRFMMHYFVDETEYVDDGEMLTGKEFYDKMRAGGVTKTVQLNQVEMEEAFRAALEKECDVLYLCFASACSGTFETASMIAKRLMEEFPGGKVYVVDSTSECGGEGRLALAMAEKKREGLSIDELRDWLEGNKGRFIHLFTVDDLMFLYRGGRLQKSAAIAGTILCIKPLMYTAPDGKLTVATKVRGRKASLKGMIDHMMEIGEDLPNQTIIINHADCPEDAEWMQAEVLRRTKVKELLVLPMGPVIGSHVGPGCIALFFTGSTREWGAQER